MTAGGPPELGWGLVGIGTLADLAIAPALGRTEGSRLTAVCSRSLDRARAFAARHRATAAYEDYAEMLADPAVDIVYVATPNALHVEHTVVAFEAGKHVLVEKPMALSLADGRVMVSAAAACGRQLGVGFHLRHKLTNRTARGLIAEGRIGRPFLADAAVGAGTDVYPYGTWRADPALSGGGTLLHQGVHTVDLLAYLTGEPVVEVMALVDRPVDERVFTATCRFRSGMLATVSSHYLRAGTRPDWVVHGEQGWLKCAGGTAPGVGDELELIDDRTEPAGVRSSRSAYDEELADFAAAVRTGGPPAATGMDGLHAIAVAEALYESAESGRTVAVADVDRMEPDTASTGEVTRVAG